MELSTLDLQQKICEIKELESKIFDLNNQICSKSDEIKRVDKTNLKYKNKINDLESENLILKDTSEFKTKQYCTILEQYESLKKLFDDKRNIETAQSKSKENSESNIEMYFFRYKIYCYTAYARLSVEL